MTDSYLDPSVPAGDAASSQRVEVGGGQGTTLFSHGDLTCLKQMPLPGVVIFVHGVNSEGEWFAAAEEGLCKGLNRRLGRLDDQMMYTGVEGGQMSPVSYTESLTPDGYLNPKLLPGSYIKDDPSFSPVIHFRWGYKADQAELKVFGPNIFLNEQNYWGGGPFANGCTSLADLWTPGIDDRVFGFLTVQGMNDTDRLVYATPPRAYMVLAALRLATLICSIREKQADAPVTVVCHSQGNIVGMTAAFFGKKMGQVADSYVLANAPYSLVSDNALENWSQRGAQDAKGERGRQTRNSRIDTLANFFKIIKQRAENEPAAEAVNVEMQNSQVSRDGKPYTAESDRTSHGLNQHTYGRVTLYCCPHDQVISAAPVQGIGWRGLSAEEIVAANGNGVFSQRVFATNWRVGDLLLVKYNYWDNDWRVDVRQNDKDFFYPPSSRARFSLKRELRGKHSVAGKIGAAVFAPLLELVTLVADLRVNALPPKDRINGKWSIPIEAPPLDEPFMPLTVKYGQVMKTLTVTGNGKSAESQFNESYDPPSAARDSSKAATDRRSGDPYDSFQADQSKLGNDEDSDATNAQGDQQSEAAQRYEDHAVLRQEARREVQIRQDKPDSWIDDDGTVVGEDDPGNASADYSDWHNKRISTILIGGQRNNPTNHSITMTNAMHAEKALAYDVAVGVCRLSADDWKKLRIEADWRMGRGVDSSSASKMYEKYFTDGTMVDSKGNSDAQNSQSLYEWVNTDGKARMPEGIEDHREGSFYLAARVAG